MAEIVNEPCGVLIVNKPQGPTSHDIVNKIRRLYSTKKVGHTGTLDPMATGVLVVLIGRAAKACEYSLSDRKKYTATLRLGIETDTEDTTGTVLQEYPVQVTENAVKEVLSSFIGKIKQIPPMYSALKVGGKKLCDLAREGIVVEREARPITVRSLTAQRLAADAYRLEVICSKGTYIRTLCADIGKALGCGGLMETLCRAEAAGFTLADAHTLEELEAADILLHVADASHPDFLLQIEAVETILAEMELDGIPRLLLCNKCDQLAAVARAELADAFPQAIFIIF